MNDLTRYDATSPSPVEIGKTDLGPKKSWDDQNIWRKFADFIRANIRLKPLHLAERFAEARIASLEAENQIKLWNAKKEYELAQAEIRRRDLEAAGQQEKTKAETEGIVINNRSAKAHARIDEAKARTAEAATRAISRRGQTPEQAMEQLRLIVDKIREAGGDVETDLPCDLV